MKLKKIRHIILLAFLVAGIVFGGFPKPREAQAACCGEVAAIQAAAAAIVGAISAAEVATIASLNQVIMGTHLAKKVFPVMVPGGMPGQDSIPIKQGAAVMGLVDYFEYVFWPRWISLEQRMQQIDDKKDGFRYSADEGRASAVTISQFATTKKVETAKYYTETMGRSEGMCSHITRLVSIGTVDIVTAVYRRQMTQITINALRGSSNAPKYAKGPREFHRAQQQERIAAGYCSPEGNNGNNKVICASAGAKPDYDVNAETIFSTFLLPDSATGAAPTLRDALAFEEKLNAESLPILSEAQLKGLPNPAAEIMTKMDKYVAQASLAAFPIKEFIASKTGLPKTDSEIYNAYMANLTKFGINTAELQGLYVKDGIMSKKAIERIHYYESNRAAAQLFELGGSSTLNNGNALVYIAMKMSDAVAMLYAIKEQLEINNMQAGMTNNLLLRDAKKEIEELAADNDIRS